MTWKELAEDINDLTPEQQKTEVLIIEGGQTFGIKAEFFDTISQSRNESINLIETLGIGHPYIALPIPAP